MNIDEIIQQYQDGTSLAQLQRELGMSVTKIKQLLISNNIRIRSAKEQTVFTNMNRRKKVNDDIFDALTKENIWLVGFIAADGTIRPTRNEIKISLSSKDREILEKIRSLLKVEREILDYETTNGFNVSQLSFSSFKIKKQLNDFGIASNKTYLPMSMKFIPENFKINFIHGYFDGDGSISTSKNKNDSSIKIVSYNSTILEEIRIFLQQSYNIRATNIYTDKRRNSLYSLEYSTIPSLKLLELFYNSNEASSIFLQRKFNKFQEVLNKRI